MSDASGAPRNRYWLLRHGHSLANEAGIIISKKANGIKQEYCLSSLGREQVKQAGLLLKEQLSAAPATNPPVLILASPFSRTLETARLVAAEVGVDPLGPHFLVRDELVERDFGSDNEGQPYAGRYEAVWAEDQRDSQHPAGNDGESVVNVAERLKALLQEVEGQHQGCNVLLVAHGDTLSICQALMTSGVGPSLCQHRQHHFNTAELKRVELQAHLRGSSSRLEHLTVHGQVVPKL